MKNSNLEMIQSQSFNPIQLPFTKTVPKICQLTTEFIDDIVDFLSGIKDVDNMLFDSIDVFLL